jgi:hypothetical protein
MSQAALRIGRPRREIQPPEARVISLDGKRLSRRLKKLRQDCYRSQKRRLIDTSPLYLPCNMSGILICCFKNGRP